MPSTSFFHSSMFWMLPKCSPKLVLKYPKSAHQFQGPCPPLQSFHAAPQKWKLHSELSPQSILPQKTPSEVSCRTNPCPHLWGPKRSRCFLCRFLHLLTIDKLSSLVNWVYIYIYILVIGHNRLEASLGGGCLIYSHLSYLRVGCPDPPFHPTTCNWCTSTICKPVPDSPCTPSAEEKPVKLELHSQRPKVSDSNLENHTSLLTPPFSLAIVQTACCLKSCPTGIWRQASSFSSQQTTEILPGLSWGGIMSRQELE